MSFGSFGPERGSGGLDNIAEHLKAHGGKLIRTEEDEEEEGDDEEKVEELPEKAEEAEKTPAPLATDKKSTFEMVADTLADPMSKVHVGSTAVNIPRLYILLHLSFL